MNRIPRRNFLKHAAAASCLSRRLAAASGRIAIVTGAPNGLSSSDPVRWAAGELRRAVEEKGDSCVIVSSPGEAGDFQAAVMLTAVTGSPVESFRLAPDQIHGKPAVRASASDQRGMVYAITEFADRVRHEANPVAALTLAAPLEERPANRVRSINRAFVSDVEDKSWFYDRDYWRDYLSYLVTNRFNRFSLAFGWGYDFPRGVTGDYLHFPYPYLVDVPGYKVRAVPLDDTERERNLEALRFIVEQTAARGLDFQLALWTHAYQWTDSPRAQHHIEGLTPETHARYCRDALALLLKTCPGIRGLTLRVHGESGVPEGSYDFWRTLFQGISGAGRPIEIDMHAKGIDQKMIDIALETGMPVKISPKYWAEHQGLGYHQAAIRELEMPRESDRIDPVFSLSNGSRRFLRYGYGDLYQQGRRYGLLYRMWAGTQRMLLWGDPASAAAFGEASHFLGADGVELCEPLFFKGRQGTGRPGGRCGYADASLNPAGGDWRKYEYTYRVWGRLLYNPKADPDQWRRYLRSSFGPAAIHAETALANASRVLPLLTTAHQPSASNLEYWVEVPPNMPMADGGRVPYNDTPAPKRFGTVSPLDPEMFSSVEELATELLSGDAGGKYSPVEVAQFFEDSCAKSARALEAAAAAVPARADPAFRRWEEDILIQVSLGRFYAAKLRAGVLFDIYRRTGDPSAHERAVTAYRNARATWAAMAERAGRVYVADLTYGEPPARRGHWLDRLPGIDRDLAAVESAQFDPKPEMQGRLKEAMARASGRPARPAFSCTHTPPRAFQVGQAVTVSLLVSGAAAPAVTLRYRHVNQAERWQSAAMQNGGQTYRAVIPAAYTQSPFALQYYFHLSQNGSAGLYPGFNEVFANRPYFVVTRA